MGRPPKVQPTELEKLEKQFDNFTEQVETLTLDRMNQAPKLETEPQTKMSQKDIEKSNDIYLKPTRIIGSRGKFNEKFRDAYNFSKEYVHFIAENKEIIGESIEMWTKPYPGVAAEFWKIPVNKPVWAPRYVAEQIKRKSYHKLVMDQTKISDQNGLGQIYGSMVVDHTIQRLDAMPVSTHKSIFMSI